MPEQTLIRCNCGKNPCHNYVTVENQLEKIYVHVSGAHDVSLWVDIDGGQKLINGLLACIMEIQKGGK